MHQVTQILICAYKDQPLFVTMVCTLWVTLFGVILVLGLMNTGKPSQISFLIVPVFVISYLRVFISHVPGYFLMLSDWLKALTIGSICYNIR